MKFFFDFRKKRFGRSLPVLVQSSNFFMLKIVKFLADCTLCFFKFYFLELSGAACQAKLSKLLKKVLIWAQSAHFCTDWTYIFTIYHYFWSTLLYHFNNPHFQCISGLLKCTAFCSGHSIGSCNWIMEFDSTKIGYISNSAYRPCHVKQVHWTAFRNLDSLLLTSLSRFPNPDPAYNCHRLTHTMVETLKRNGNVLFPVNPVGHVFDLLEVIFTGLEQVI